MAGSIPNQLYLHSSLAMKSRRCPHVCLSVTSLHRYLSEVVFQKRPLIVTDYPKDIKAFYMRLNDDQQTVAAMDLLVPK
jgi:aspartyl/asparaginyl-tRNA synthetase